MKLWKNHEMPNQSPEPTPVGAGSSASRPRRERLNLPRLHKYIRRVDRLSGTPTILLPDGVVDDFLRAELRVGFVGHDLLKRHDNQLVCGAAPVMRGGCAAPAVFTTWPAGSQSVISVRTEKPRP